MLSLIGAHSAYSAAISLWSGNGNALDSVGGNNGTLVGDTTFVTGIVGQAFSLDGDGDYIEVADDNTLDLTSATGVSIAMWINPASSPTSNRLLDKITAGGTNGYLLDIVGGKLRMIVGSTLITGTTTIPSGVNSHVAGTFDGTNITLYLNGVQEATAAASIANFANSNTLRIGADSSGANPFHGIIDEVQLFDSALSLSEVGTLVPEPSTYAFAFGSIVLLFSIYYKRAHR